MNKKIMERCGRRRSIKESVCSNQINTNDAIDAAEDLAEVLGYAAVNEAMARTLSTDELNDLLRELSRDFDVDLIFGKEVGQTDDAGVAFEEFEDLCAQLGDSVIFDDMIKILDSYTLAENVAFICNQYDYDSPYLVEVCEEGVELPVKVDEFEAEEWPDPVAEIDIFGQDEELSELHEEAEEEQDPFRARIELIKKALGIKNKVNEPIEESMDAETEEICNAYCKEQGCDCENCDCEAEVTEGMEFGSPISTQEEVKQITEDVESEPEVVTAAEIKTEIAKEEPKDICAVCGNKIDREKDSHIDGLGYICPTCEAEARKLAK